MSKTGIVLTVVGLTIICGVAGVINHVVNRTVDTASQMADKTVFNADKNVYAYEDFRKKHTAYEQYRLQIEDAQDQLESMEKKGITSGSRYDNVVMTLEGSKQMSRKIAADYNAMSKIAYQKIWKGSLPETLGDK